MIRTWRRSAAACAALTLTATGGLAQARKAPAVPAAVPAAFREAVGEELKTGLTLADSREVSAAGGKYFVAIYLYPESDKEHGGDKKLEIYFLAPDAKAPKGTELYTERMIDLGTYDDPKTVFADVNGDGATDMLVSVSNGGNCWQCSRALVYSLDGAELRFLAAEPMTLKDLDGDGKLELLVGDTRWEGYDDFSHAAAPGGTLVYRWRPESGGYVFAGMDASATCSDAELARLRAEVPELVKDMDPNLEFPDESYVSNAIQTYLVYVYTGRAEEGRAELARMLGEHVPNDAARARRKRIMDDFLTGNSAKELASPKRGEALRKATNAPPEY
jgi:hypothetical protein